MVGKVCDDVVDNYVPRKEILVRWLLILLINK